MFIGIRKLKLMLFTICFFAFGEQAFANKYYVGLRGAAVGGAAKFADSIKMSPDSDEKDSLAGAYALSIGTEFNLLDHQHVKLELEYNLQGTRNLADLMFKVNDDQNSNNILSHSMMLNLSPVFNITNDIKVIPTVGLGFALNKSMDSSISVKNRNHLAYSYGLLMGKNLTKDLELQTGYKRVSLGSVKANNINYKAFDFGGNSTSSKSVTANQFMVGLNVSL